MGKIKKFLDRFYFGLKALFNDEDSSFGSRQMYLFSITLSSYIYIPILLLLRLFLSQNVLSELKSIVQIIVVLILLIVAYWTFKNYSDFKKEESFSLSENEKIYYLFFFFLPYVVIILLYYN